ncbi:DUF4312 family protein [Paenibacillus albiflavus]|uniref:DUF4312 family protein n=1 Tax=Paenibacillus albiflavus TaxID=2545760 RepID=A0A4R4EMG7_9BACL|nr:DUF4312 family protein [Paenibacillus albiflavus]TCZ81027.1 DUF4312 family protein [Paenibacillus albiflavus]
MFQVMERSITVSGTAETKKGAFQNALSQMKKDIAKNNPDILLQIEPQDVEVLTAKVSTYREKFLGFLFPRTRTRYEITIRVDVKIRAVSLAEVQFEEHAESLPPLQRVLRMR